jgi:hypothetical protein
MSVFSKSLVLGVALTVILHLGMASAIGLGPEIKELKLKSGSHTLIRKDSTKNGKIIHYRFYGKAGQTLILRISSRPFGTVVPIGSIIRSDNGQPIALAYDGIERWTVTLTKSGDYFFSVGSRVPNKGKTSFTLAVSLRLSINYSPT